MSDKPLTDKEEVAAELSVVIKELVDNKITEITILDLTPVHGYLQYFVIVTALSTVHLKKVAADIRFKLKELDLHIKVVPNEQEISSGWVILDYYDIVIHLFLEDTRAFYALETLWKDARHIDYTSFINELYIT